MGTIKATAKDRREWKAENRRWLKESIKGYIYTNTINKRRDVNGNMHYMIQVFAGDEKGATSSPLHNFSRWVKAALGLRYNAEYNAVWTACTPEQLVEWLGRDVFNDKMWQREM